MNRINYDKKITRVAASVPEGEVVPYIMLGHKWYLRGGKLHKVTPQIGAVQWWTGNGWRTCRVAS